MRVTEQMVLDAYKEKLRAGKAAMREKSKTPYNLEKVRPKVKRSAEASAKHGFLEKVYFEGYVAAKEYYS